MTQKEMAERVGDLYWRSIPEMSNISEFALEGAEIRKYLFSSIPKPVVDVEQAVYDDLAMWYVKINRELIGDGTPYAENAKRQAEHIALALGVKTKFAKVEE